MIAQKGSINSGIHSSCWAARDIEELAHYDYDKNCFYDYDYDNSRFYNNGSCRDYLIFCTHALVEGTNYENDVAPGNTVYTEKEKLQFTLDLFVKNDLQPVFDDPEMTELYRKMYVEKPALLKELEAVETEIAAEEEKIRAAQAVQLLSSEFDYHNFLAKYDIAAADGSVIQYYLTVERWTNELLEKLDYYEEKKADLIRDFGTIGLALAKTYADWQKIRFHIEEDFRPVIECGLKGPFLTVKKEKKTVPEALIAALGAYRDAVDAFFLEERKGIYQNYAFQAGGAKNLEAPLFEFSPIPAARSRPEASRNVPAFPAGLAPPG